MTAPVAVPARRADPRRSADPRRVALALLFASYLVVLGWLVLWKLHEPFIGWDSMRSVKLVPFVAAEGFGASRPSEVLGNVVVFVPFGIYLGLLVRSWSWLHVVGTVASVSLALEVAQYVLAVGSTDLTDVIANATGGLLGLGVAALVRRRSGAMAALTWLLVAGTLVMLGAVALLVVMRRMTGLPIGLG